MDLGTILGLATAACIIALIIGMRMTSGRVKLSRPAIRVLPTTITPVDNDKLIVIEPAIVEDVKAVTKEFCDLYNAQEYKCVAKLAAINEKQVLLTFPLDIDFEIFCYFVNYLHHDLKDHSQTKGWITVEQGQVSTDFYGKRVMVYVQADDKEGDNVSLTSIDGKGYLYGFSIRGKKKLPGPTAPFMASPVDLKAAKDLNGEMIF